MQEDAWLADVPRPAQAVVPTHGVIHLQFRPEASLRHHATREECPLAARGTAHPRCTESVILAFRSALGRMTRLDGLGSVPEFKQVFCQTDYSFEISCRQGDSRYGARRVHRPSMPVECSMGLPLGYACPRACRQRRSLSTPRALERVRELAAGGNDVHRQAAVKRLKESDEPGCRNWLTRVQSSIWRIYATRRHAYASVDMHQGTTSPLCPSYMVRIHMNLALFKVRPAASGSRVSAG